MKNLLSFGVVLASAACLHAADPQPAPPAPPAAAERGMMERGGDHRGPKGAWKGDRMKRDKGREGHGKWKGGRDEHGPMGRPGPKGGMDRMGPKNEGRQKMAAMAGMLRLTAEQKAKAKALMQAAKPKIQAIQEEGQAKVRAVMAESLKELRPLLTPEQQAIFDDLQKLQADRAALKAAKTTAAPAKPE